MDLGTTLRAARERKGLSLEELAARTKIPGKILRAIESNDFSKIPPGLFARSFIRTYALAVGVDPTASVAEFRAVTEPALVAAPAESARSRILPSDDEPGLLGSPSLQWSVVVIVAAVLFSIVLINRNPAALSAVPPESQAKPSVVVPLPDNPTGPDTTGVTPNTQTPAGIENGIQVEMRADRLCWIRAVVDGEEAFARLLHRGETATVRGKREVVLRVGDPKALSYWINGQPGESLGPPEVPVTIRFGVDGVKSRVS
jgi:cytoskeleton protein RodZ